MASVGAAVMGMQSRKMATYIAVRQINVKWFRLTAQKVKGVMIQVL
jgi:hypothetical protein